MNIFVAKLNFATDENFLQDAFSQFGEVESVKIIRDRDTGRSKGYGFVEMVNEDDGYEAINTLNESELDGRTIVCKKSEPRKKPNFGGGGGSNFGGGGRNSY